MYTVIGVVVLLLQIFSLWKIHDQHCFRAYMNLYKQPITQQNRKTTNNNRLILAKLITTF